jgi:hypothetical protein
MTLESIVLRKLVETLPAGERHHVLVTEGPWTVTLTAERRDDLSCLLWQIDAERGAGAPGDVAAWAARIATQASGLMETLKVVEVDDVQRAALLRSTKATEKGDDRFYYEIHLRGTSRATVRRYQGAGAGKAREQIAFALTNETIAKLADDLTAE